MCRPMLSHTMTLFSFQMLRKNLGNFDQVRKLKLSGLAPFKTLIPQRTCAKEKVYALAVCFLAGEINYSLINILEKTDKLTKSIGSWSARRLTLFGNIAILKTKLRVFQCKFPHRRIAANDFLLKIGLIQTHYIVHSCSFCKVATETMVHLFWSCKHTYNF